MRKEMKKMKRFSLLLCSAFLLASILMIGSRALAQEGAPAGGGRGAAPGSPAEPVPPGEEIKALALAQLKLMGGNIVQIAKDMPADKLGWNPGQTAYTPLPADPTSHDYGRSFANLCLHLANLSFSAPPRWGAAPSPAFDTKIKNYEDSTTDRAKLVEQLTAAFAYGQTEVGKLSVADLNRRIKAGNTDTNANMIIATWIAGINDYFGQAKAYAHFQMVPGTDPGGFRPYDPVGKK
jgi:hypothetical protein